MSAHIRNVVITSLNGSAHIINTDTHVGTGDFFRTEQDAELFLTSEGFTWDPARMNDRQETDPHGEHLQPVPRPENPREVGSLALEWQ